MKYLLVQLHDFWANCIFSLMKFLVSKGDLFSFLSSTCTTFSNAKDTDFTVSVGLFLFLSSSLDVDA